MLLVVMILLIVNLCATGIIGISVWRADSDRTQDGTVQYTMYVGTNDKDTYEQVTSTEEAKAVIDGICFEYLDSYTICDATGSWTDEEGVPTHESTIVCYFDGADEETVYKIADEVIEALRQNTVLIEKDLIQADYYGGAG